MQFQRHFEGRSKGLTKESWGLSENGLKGLKAKGNSGILFYNYENWIGVSYFRTE